MDRWHVTRGTRREELLTAGMYLAACGAAQGTIAEKITDAAARIGSTTRKTYQVYISEMEGRANKETKNYDAPDV